MYLYIWQIFGLLLSFEFLLLKLGKACDFKAADREAHLYPLGEPWSNT